MSKQRQEEDDYHEGFDDPSGESPSLVKSEVPHQSRPAN